MYNWQILIAAIEVFEKKDRGQFYIKNFFIPFACKKCSIWNLQISHLNWRLWWSGQNSFHGWGWLKQRRNKINSQQLSLVRWKPSCIIAGRSSSKIFYWYVYWTSGQPFHASTNFADLKFLQSIWTLHINYEEIRGTGMTEL